MQQTSALYKRLVADPNSWFETRVVIGESGNLITERGEKILFGGVGIIVARDSPDSGFTESTVKRVETSTAMFSNKPRIGAVIKQQLDLTMLNPSGEIPRMAQVVVYIRCCTATEESEWLKQGEFFIDYRQITHNDDGLDTLTIHAFDALMKTEQDYGSTSLNFPATDIDIVREIAGKIGVEVDSRTVTLMNASYRLPLPTSYSLGEVLGYIGSMYLGNWIITEQGELRLISLTELPKETRYLVDNAGFAITFGQNQQAETDTVEGQVVTFNAYETDAIRNLTVSVEAVQKGGGDASPTNIRDIVGWTDCEIAVDRSKVFNTTCDQGGIAGSSGSTTSSDYRIRSGWVAIEPNTTYTAKSNLPYICVRLYEGTNKTTIIPSSSTNLTSNTVTFTSPTNAHYARFVLAKSSGSTILVTPSDFLWCNVVSSAGTAKTVSLGRTVYGASLDVTTGALAVGKADDDLSTLSWDTRYTGTTNKVVSASLSSSAVVVLRDSLRYIDGIAEYYTNKGHKSAVSRFSDPDSLDVGFYCIAGASTASVSSLYLVIPVDASPSGKIIYTIPTPQTYQLTAQQISNLVGQNTMWASTGDVNVTWQTQMAGEPTRILV